MRKSRLSWSKQCRLIELFVAGATVRMAAALAGVNRNTARHYFHRLREVIMANSEQCGMFAGEIEDDESYFGGHRHGKRGRGAAGKVPVFGLLKRHGKVFTAIIMATRRTTLLPIIRDRVKPQSVVYTDSHHALSCAGCVGVQTSPRQSQRLFCRWSQSHQWY